MVGPAGAAVVPAPAPVAVVAPPVAPASPAGGVGAAFAPPLAGFLTSSTIPATSPGDQSSVLGSTIMRREVVSPFGMT